MTASLNHPVDTHGVSINILFIEVEAEAEYWHTLDVRIPFFQGHGTPCMVNTQMINSHSYIIANQMILAYKKFLTFGEESRMRVKQCVKDRESK